MTLSAIGTVAAVFILIAGVVYFARVPDRRRVVGLVGTVVVATTIAWLAWFAGVTPAGM